MTGYDAQLLDIAGQSLALLSGLDTQKIPAGEVSAWPAPPEPEFFMQGSARLTLGGSLLGGAGYLTAVFGEAGEIKDEIILCGPQLGELREDAPYARISLLRLNGEGLDERGRFDLMLDLQNSRHRVALAGCSVEFAEAGRYEILRATDGAIKKGLSLPRIAEAYIEEYKREARVLSVTELLVTHPDFDYAAAQALGGRVRRTMMALRSTGTLNSNIRLN